jgi:hypothetical protein
MRPIALSMILVMIIAFRPFDGFGDTSQPVTLQQTATRFLPAL